MHRLFTPEESKKIYLAPMEGVVDYVVRDLWAQIGGIDEGVTEFIRVVDQLLPEKVFYQYSPELYRGGKTTSGVPVHIQLLGSNAQKMAENALRAYQLGSEAIDLNFGCPAKTVNKNSGGAKLLTDIEGLYQLVSKIRDSLPRQVPLTAKIRLGYEDDSQSLEIAQALEQAGISRLAVHGRTKLQAYRPPVNWRAIGQINNHLKIPVIANGDIWTPQDFVNCKQVTRCHDFMLGRGIVARPSLAREIKFNQQVFSHLELSPLLYSFINNSIQFRNEKYGLQRTKQLLKLWGQTYPEYRVLFTAIKRCKDLQSLQDHLRLFFKTYGVTWPNLNTQFWWSLENSNDLFPEELASYLDNSRLTNLSENTFRLQPKSLAKTSNDLRL